MRKRAVFSKMKVSRERVLGFCNDMAIETQQRFPPWLLALTLIVKELSTKQKLGDLKLHRVGHGDP